MNVLNGVITGILTEDEISLVCVDSNGSSFTAIVIDTPADSNYLQLDHNVHLIFKETEVMIAKTGPLAISVQNRIACSIKKIIMGKILCQIELQIISASEDTGPIGCIITRNACEQLELKQGEHVTALIKTNEVSLSHQNPSVPVNPAVHINPSANLNRSARANLSAHD